jgi:hypothetical protein
VEPSLYVLGGQFLLLDLVNKGQTATEIRVDCKWDGSVKKFYIVSLNTGGRARLEGISIQDIVQQGRKFSISYLKEIFHAFSIIPLKYFGW